MIGELFCGAGGLGLAAKQLRNEFAGLEVAWAIDIDEDACETYRRNILPRDRNRVLCRNVRRLKGTWASAPPIDGLVFGFPCNDFSRLGEAKGFMGGYGRLYAESRTVLEQTMPDWFLAENVPALSAARGGQGVARVAGELSRAGPGYTVTAHVFRFEDYGVPQRRHRLVFVGIRGDLGLTYEIPAPTARRLRTSREVLDARPIRNDVANHEIPRTSARVRDRLRLIPPGNNAWLLDDLLELSDTELVARFAPRVAELAAERPAVEWNDAESIRVEIRRVKLNVKSARMSLIYRRLEPNRPAYTVVGSGGGGTYMYHWREHRALTNRERARLQTFPDSFEFVGGVSSVRKQIGMAVPPRGGRAVLRGILRTLRGDPYKAVNPSEGYWHAG